MSSNSQALTLLARERPDAVLLDCGLTDGRATTVAEALQGAGVPFAVMTGEAADGLTEAAFATAPRIAKPVLGMLWFAWCAS